VAVLERARRILLTADGVFLAVIGSVQVLLEVVAYYGGAVPYGELFERSPDLIGWLEAHGMAFLIGVLLLAVARNDLRRFWHVFAAAVHVLLGGANIVFWDSFLAFGMVPMGVAATVVHVVFVMLHAAALLSRARPAALAPASG
jgi:hypothetical protein